MYRYSGAVGPKQLVSITALFLLLGVTAFILLFGTVLASSRPNLPEELSSISWAKEVASPPAAGEAAERDS